MRKSISIKVENTISDVKDIKEQYGQICSYFLYGSLKTKPKPSRRVQSMISLLLFWLKYYGVEKDQFRNLYHSSESLRDREEQNRIHFYYKYSEFISENDPQRKDQYVRNKAMVELSQVIRSLKLQTAMNASIRKESNDDSKQLFILEQLKIISI